MKEKLIRMGKGFLVGALGTLFLLVAYRIIALLLGNVGNVKEVVDLMEEICFSILTTCLTVATVLWYLAEEKKWHLIVVGAIIAQGALLLSILY